MTELTTTENLLLLAKLELADTLTERLNIRNARHDTLPQEDRLVHAAVSRILAGLLDDTMTQVKELATKRGWTLSDPEASPQETLAKVIGLFDGNRRTVRLGFL